jgi:hypothetical protein
MSDERYLDDPASVFVGRLVDETRESTISGFREYLEGGPAGRSPRPSQGALHRWFRSLDGYGREKVVEVVREAVDGALFGALLLLDQEDPFGEDQLYDFALYLQVYDDGESHEVNRSSYRSKKLNGPEDPEPLRNKYLGAIDKLEEEVDG